MRVVYTLLSALLLAAPVAAEDAPTNPPEAATPATETAAPSPAEVADAAAAKRNAWEKQLIPIGARALPLQTIDWVKGKPLTNAADTNGKITVVEFWATWCAPCMQTIPHLTQLQKKYADKVIIVSLTDEAPELAPTPEDPEAMRDIVREFVKEQGARMAYHVGIVGEEERSLYLPKGAFIPFAYIVSADGVVLWRGFAGDIDRPLALAVAGKIDQDTEKRLWDLNCAMRKLSQAKESKTEELLQVTSEILAAAPGDSSALNMRLAVARGLRDHALFRQTLESIPVDSTEPEQLSMLAFQLLSEQDLRWRALDQAIRFAKVAAERMPDDADAIDTFARILYTLGLVDEAIAAETKACELASKGGNPEEKQFYEAILAYYQDVKNAQRAFKRQ
jgi:thiol-disulfide isomerase/thioredoxin